MYLSSLLFIAGSILTIHGLITKAGIRRKAYLRPGSRLNILRHFKIFLYFCAHFNLHDACLTPDILCAFIEFLIPCYKSPATIKNVISSVSTVFSWLDRNREVFRHVKLAQMFRSLDLTIRYFPPKPYVLTLSDLHLLSAGAEILGRNAVMFRSFLLMLFFTMVRVSSLLPLSNGGFDSTRHITVGDLAPTSEGLSVAIKWSKSHQSATSAFRLPVRYNACSDICPVRALHNYLRSRPGVGGSGPLFWYCSNSGGNLPLTISMANSLLKLIVRSDPQLSGRISFHAFRRGACTAAFACGAPVSDLRLFGGWRSDSIFSYLHTEPARVRVADKLSFSHP